MSGERTLAGRRDDIRLAQQAAAEIAEAQREIRRAQSYYSLAVSADVSAAEALLAQARQTWPTQAYEQVIQLAGMAEQAARAAYDDAVKRALWKQMELDQKRRQQQAAARRRTTFDPGGSLVSAAWSSGSGSPSASSGQSVLSSARSSSWSSGSGSSASAWSSGSSQSSW